MESVMAQSTVLCFIYREIPHKHVYKYTIKHIEYLFVLNITTHYAFVLFGSTRYVEENSEC